MTDDLHNASELIEELEGLSITTTQGSFIKMEDVRRLIEKRQKANAVQEHETEEAPKNIHEARRKAKEFLGKEFGQKSVPEPGRSIPATEAQPSSRT